MTALRSRLVVVLGALAIWPTGAAAMDARDIPTQAPHDGIMASPSEVQEVQRWAAAAFGAARPQSPGSEAGIRVLRQDHNTLHYGQSFMETPLRIGSRRHAMRLLAVSGVTRMIEFFITQGTGGVS